MGEGARANKVQRKIHARKNWEKKIHVQRVAQIKTFLYTGRKIFLQENANEKNSCSSKIPPPPPSNNFSNSPFLKRRVEGGGLPDHISLKIKQSFHEDSNSSSFTTFLRDHGYKVAIHDN